MDELMICSVVVYWLPLHDANQRAKCIEHLERTPRSTALYLTKHGPVYIRVAISSSSLTSAPPSRASLLLIRFSSGSNTASGVALR
eukprot:2594363-Prymnesium_polylepis.1